MPKISVIIPVFNAEVYLSECLESVLSQSLTDFEIIAVDDASTDGSPRILAEYAAKDSRIKVIHLQENKGGLQARNIGIRAATGKYTMFLDSDDCLLPGILQAAYQTAEKENADLVHFILEFHSRRDSSGKILRSIFPMNHAVYGEDVFFQFFVKDSFHWRMVEKLHRTDICKKTVDHIPDSFCMMADDFCFSVIYAFFAKCYVPLKLPGYIYYDPGVTRYQEIDLQRFLKRQSPFQALRNVSDFLKEQNVWDKYHEAFEKQEQKLLHEYVLRWVKNLSGGDRISAMREIFRQYPALPLFQAFRKLDKTLYPMFDGESAKPVWRTSPIRRIGSDSPYAGGILLPAISDRGISEGRWQEWTDQVKENGLDVIILSADNDLERLFWDIIAIQSSGAMVVLRWKNSLFSSVRDDFFQTVHLEQICHFADAVMLPDENSVFWFRSSGFRAITDSAGSESLKNMLAQPPMPNSKEVLCCPHAEDFFKLLNDIRKKLQDNYIKPAPDGETFVPFFRKLNTLFLKLPAGFRKKMFGKLNRIYNKIRGY